MRLRLSSLCTELGSVVLSTKHSCIVTETAFCHSLVILIELSSPHYPWAAQWVKWSALMAILKVCSNIFTASRIKSLFEGLPLCGCARAQCRVYFRGSNV